ncbi:MAG TPA: YIP1 family protein, partial [Steroidobacteraceae bacterium]|nr:YIP1 family protein [Steroidobacteraceae bacterium]
MNALSLAWSFFVTPDAALRQLRAKPTFLFPLLLVTLGSAALLLWQYALVDIDWLKDYLMSGNARFKALPDAERARALAVMTRTTLSVAGVAALVIGTPAICLLQALYYFVAGRVTHVAVSYRQWFALVCWT